jgi:hypothetical protein
MYTVRKGLGRDKMRHFPGQAFRGICASLVGGVGDR